MGCVEKWNGDKGTGTSGRVCGDLGLGDARRLSRNFSMPTCVKFTFANIIEAMSERSHVTVKVESRSDFTFNLNNLYLAFILFT